MHDRLQRLGKPGRKRRLAVAAQRHVPQLQQVVRQRTVGGPLAQPPAAHQGQRLLQFPGHGLDLHQFRRPLLSAVHFAIDAPEIAALVGRQVDADRQTAGARGHHRIHETIVQKIARRAKGGFLAAGKPLWPFPLLFRRPNRSCGFWNDFFHNNQTTLAAPPAALYTMLAKE